MIDIWCRYRRYSRVEVREQLPKRLSSCHSGHVEERIKSHSNFFQGIDKAVIWHSPEELILISELRDLLHKFSGGCTVINAVDADHKTLVYRGESFKYLANELCFIRHVGY